MKSYEWWLKQKKRIRKKYELICGMYLSPKETKNFAKRFMNHTTKACGITDTNDKEELV